MKRLLLTICLLLAFSGMAMAQATPGPTLPGAVSVTNTVERADSCNQVQHSHTTGATITLTVGVAGGPQGIAAICAIDIANVQDATGVAAAAATFITTTGINGSPQYVVASGTASAGLESPFKMINFTAPLKSAQSGTNVTFVLPTFATHQTISVNVYFRLVAQ